jgi:adenosylcobinamide-GDP ribazoletransferase
MFMGGYFVLALGLVYQMLVRPAALGIWLTGFVMSRALAVLAMSWLPYAREDGLARFFGDQSNRSVLRVISAGYVLIALSLMIMTSPSGALVTAVLLTLGGYLYRRMCIRGFGGLTGDLLGFGITVSELLILTGAVTGGLL